MIPPLSLGKGTLSDPRRQNTIPCTQTNFDVLMMAMHKLADRVSALEEKSRRGEDE